MIKTTLKELKQLVKNGLAVDITTKKEKITGLEKVAFSFGVYGINGGLLKDNNGNLYAITARATTLFIYF